MPFEPKNPDLVKFYNIVKDHYFQWEAYRYNTGRCPFGTLAAAGLQDATRGFCTNIVTSFISMRMIGQYDTPEIPNLSMDDLPPHTIQEYVLKMNEMSDLWMEKHNVLIKTPEQREEVMKQIKESDEYKEIIDSFLKNSMTSPTKGYEKRLCELCVIGITRPGRSTQLMEPVSLYNFTDRILINQQLRLMEKLDNNEFDMSENSEDRKAFEFGLACAIDRQGDVAGLQNHSISFSKFAAAASISQKRGTTIQQENELIMKTAKILSDSILEGKEVTDFSFLADGEACICDIGKQIASLSATCDEKKMIESELVLDSYATLLNLKTLDKTNLSKYVEQNKKISEMSSVIALYKERIFQEQIKIKEEIQAELLKKEEWSEHSLLYRTFHRTPVINGQKVKKHTLIRDKMEKQVEDMQLKCNKLTASNNPNYLAARQELLYWGKEHNLDATSRAILSKREVLEYEKLAMNVATKDFEAKVIVGLANNVESERECMLGEKRCAIEEQMVKMAKNPEEIESMILTRRYQNASHNAISSMLQKEHVNSSPAAATAKTDNAPAPAISQTQAMQNEK